MDTTPVTPSAGADDEYSTPIPQQGGGGVTAPATVSTGTDGTSGPPEDEYSTPIPGNPQSVPTSGDSSLQMNPDDSLGTTVAKGANAIGAGVGEGLLSTANGAATLLHLPHQLLEDRQKELEQDNAGNPILNKIGYGGETLVEFMMGDEALKALPIAQRLEAAAKTMRVFEKSPKLMKAMQLGAEALNTGARTGAVQGAQTLVRTGGDVEQAAKDAAVGGATGTVLGGATGTLGEVLSNAGATAEKATALSEAAGDADTKEEVAKATKEKIDTAKNQLHSDYESGIQDLEKRLQGSEVNAQNNPLADKAKDLLKTPTPEDHPLVSQAREAAGDRLDKKVRTLLESIASGELPVEEDATAEAPKPSGLVGPDGNPIKSEQVEEPATKPAPPYQVHDLVQLRQTIRNLADSYEYGDVNSRALRSLLGDPIDNTIEHLAQKSGDATAVSDYQALRKNYRDKINLFDEPVIQKLRDGKVDDAAKDFVGVSRDGSALPTSGKVRFNVNALRGIIGDDGVHDFSKKVFGTMLKDSVDKGQFNPAKFVKTFNRVSEETKGQQFFDMEGANKGLNQLYKDAQSAANLQHLTRVGVLVPASAAVGGLTGGGLHVGIGALLGLTVAEGGGLQAGRDLLNYVANHPKVWDAYKVIGKAANGKAASAAATATRGATSQAATTLLGSDPSESRRKRLMDRATAALSGGEPTPNTHVFNTTQWASHPDNKGKDVNQAIAEAKRQGYKVVQ